MMGGVRTVSAGILSGCKKSPSTWSLLVWDGYADPSFIQGFEAQCQISKV
jgi:spermidine/putrescine-binding protein